MIKYKQEEAGNMFCNNLRFYRLKNNLSKAKLAQKVDVSPMAITNYENGNRKPDISVIKKLAEALNVKVSDFLIKRNEELIFSHEEFKKNSKLNKNQQNYIRESVEEYFCRFFESVELLGGEVLPDTPICYSLEFTDCIEENAVALRKYLKIAENGPVGNLVELLENRGILVCLMNIENDAFSGVNGTVNGRPYVAINKNMTAERMRTTLGHELAHFAFKWPESMTDKEKEDLATKISGAFLLPKEDAIRELGVHRSSIRTDMYMVCKEYGIAMSLLVMRARACNIISNQVAKNYFISLNKKGGRENELSQIPKEEALLFAQLVYRAVNEEEITIQKGAELLQISYDKVAANCCYIGE